MGHTMIREKGKVDRAKEVVSSDFMEKGLRFAIREGGRTVGAGAISEIIK